MDVRIIFALFFLVATVKCAPQILAAGVAVGGTVTPAPPPTPAPVTPAPPTTAAPPLPCYPLPTCTPCPACPTLTPPIETTTPASGAVTTTNPNSNTCSCGKGDFFNHLCEHLKGNSKDTVVFKMKYKKKSSKKEHSGSHHCD